MNPDVILPEIRDLAANATRAAKSPIGCSDAHCAYRHRAEALAAKFTTLDQALTGGELIPLAWAGGPDLPAPRTALDD